MCSQLMSGSSYSSTSLTRADAYDVQEVRQRSAKVIAITTAANQEVARVGAHAVGAMAQLVKDAGAVRRQLTDSGYRSEIFDDAHNKVLQVTGTNLITLANTAQKEILQQASSFMR